MADAAALLGWRNIRAATGRLPARAIVAWQRQVVGIQLYNYIAISLYSYLTIYSKSLYSYTGLPCQTWPRTAPKSWKIHKRGKQQGRPLGLPGCATRTACVRVCLSVRLSVCLYVCLRYERLDELIRGHALPSDLPALAVEYDCGKLWSVDNRRLLVLKWLQVCRQNEISLATCKINRSKERFWNL